jgi:predicted short-subunit dehydrogenase-like oxidoreductase (DUF2520 family)
LADAGVKVAGVISSRREAAIELAEAVSAPVASTDPTDLPSAARAVFLCVPDDAIDGVAAELAAVPHRWGETVAAHTSGARPAAALAPLAQAGAATLSFHPMQTFPERHRPDGFDGIYVGVEGVDAAVAYGEAIATRIGATPMPLSPEAKTRVHAAAALASNGFAALLAVVRDVLATAGFAPDDATGVVKPLIDQTWANLSNEAPETAMTGPIARGDRGTVADHLAALGDAAPHFLPVYTALAVEQVRVAVRGGRLSEDEAGAILDALAAADVDIVPNTSGSDVSVTEA